MWWEPFTFKEAEWYCWRLAGSEIFIRRQGKTWQSYYKRVRWEKRSTSCSGPVEEEPVSHENLQSDIINRRTAALRPCLPEKPFLLRLGGVKFFPGMKLALDLKLPPHLNLIAETSKGSHDHIFSFIPFGLKETWYGKNTMDGFFCYSLPIDAVEGTIGEAAEMPAEIPMDHAVSLAIHFRLLIHSQAKTVLELDKIPFYSAGLAVYEKNGALTSDTAHIDVLENDFRMTVVSAKSEGCSLLAHGQKQEPRHVYQGTQIIKNLAGL
jgi:hypothetical protein